jgi:DNA topoisomerase IB
LEFTGKKGVPNKYTVNHPAMIEALRARIASRNPEEPLFPQTSDTSVRRALYAVSPNQARYQVKDLRALRATEIAMEHMNMLPKTGDSVATRKVKMEIARKVAERLSNTPGVALKHYIDPAVFGRES